MKNRSVAGLVAGVALTLIALAPAAGAAVTVRVEGLNAPLLHPTTADPAAFTKTATNDGQPHGCAADTALAGLHAATAGDWAGNWSFGTFVVDTVKGESHTFGSGAYWSVYVNSRYSNAGACSEPVADGDEVLFYAADDSFVAGDGGWSGEPLELTGPAVAAPGQAFTVRVREANTTFDDSYAGTTTLADSQGASVGGALTGADGRARLTLHQRGPATLRATKGDRVPDEYEICVTDGADGFCGTTAAAAGGGGAAPAAAPVVNRCAAQTRAAYAFITSITEQQRFEDSAPRSLRGRADADACGVEKVQLRLTRRLGKRCWTFDAAGAFVRMRRCGAHRGTWFDAGLLGSDWSYLLPSVPGKGRYVLDARTVNRAGRRDDVAHRGRNRIVYHVR